MVAFVISYSMLIHSELSIIYNLLTFTNHPSTIILINNLYCKIDIFPYFSYLKLSTDEVGEKFKKKSPLSSLEIKTSFILENVPLK